MLSEKAIVLAQVLPVVLLHDKSRLNAVLLDISVYRHIVLRLIRRVHRDRIVFDDTPRSQAIPGYL